MELNFNCCFSIYSPKDIVNLKNEIERRAKEGEAANADTSTETESSNKTPTEIADSATSSNNTQAVEQQATSSS